MKTVHKLATASAVAFSAFAFVALTGSAAQEAAGCYGDTVRDDHLAGHKYEGGTN
jgi:hypothetical protein